VLSGAAICSSCTMFCLLSISCITLNHCV
jgi:hypothetical protein